MDKLHTANRRYTLFVGIATFIVLGLLSIHFYKERVFFLDLSYILFKIIQQNSLDIQINRFVSSFTQAFPYVGVQLNLPLSQIAKLYSISFVVFQFTTFLILLKFLKHDFLALGLLLLNTLIVTHIFYWTPSELIQGMAILFLFLAVLDQLVSQPRPNYFFLKHISCMLLLVTVCFAHPLIIFPLVFAQLFMMSNYNSKIKTILFYLFSTVIIYYLKSILLSNDYDASHTKQIENLIDLFPDYATHSLTNFFGYLLKEYLFMTLLFLGLTLYYIWQKCFIKLLLIIGFFTFYTLLINVCFPKVEFQAYLESQYLPLSFFLIFPLVTEVLPKYANRRLTYLLLTILLISSIFRIYKAHTLYTERVEWNRDLLAKCRLANKDKLILLDKELPKEVIFRSWALGFESWIQSTIENSKTQSIVAVRNEKIFDNYLDKPNYFLVKWNTLPYHYLNSDYFILEDTMSTYQKIALDELYSTTD